MKAWRVHGNNDVRCDELPSQNVGPECVKLKISYSSISLTDRLVYDGSISSDKLPLIIGREGVGLVTETGSNVKSVERGDRVAVDPFLSCGFCANCKSGNYGECDKMLTGGVNEDGFLRDFAVVNETDVYKLPERIKENEAVFLEYVALAQNAFAKLKIEKGEHIAIVGANIAGMILTQIALYYQAVPIVIDSRKDRLDIAQKLGAYYTVNSVDTDVYKKIVSLTGGRMVEGIAHMAHSDMPLNKTLSYAAKGARAAFVGWSGLPYEHNLSLAPLLNKHITLIGVNNGSKFMSSAINMLANKSVNVTPFITAEIPFDEAGEALRQYSENHSRFIKILIKGV